MSSTYSINSSPCLEASPCCCFSDSLQRRIAVRRTSKFFASIAIPTTWRYRCWRKHCSNKRSMTACSCFWTPLLTTRDVSSSLEALSCGKVVSVLVSSSRDKSDFEGRADCENGVIGEAKLADVFVAPFEEGNAVLRDNGASPTDERRLADSEMNVSIHLATLELETCKVKMRVGCPTNNCLLELATLIQVQQFPSS